jgi:outer membrane protein insertion porin family
VRVRLILILLFSFLCHFAFANDEQSRPAEFRGVAPDDVVFIKKHLPEVGYPNPSQAALDDVIRELMRLGSYSTARVELIDGRYVIIANQLKKVTEIAISGNSNMGEEDVLNALGIKTGSYFDEMTVSEAGEKVKELYGKHGFFNTIVSFDFKDIPPASVRIAVNVKERAPCRINEINFESENKELNTKLKGIAKKYLAKNFTDETITGLEQALKEYLTDHRFINSQLQQKSAAYNDEKTSASLVYEVSDPYRYELLLSGQQFYSDGRIISEIKIDQFTRGSQDVALDVGQLIKNFYYHNGFSQVQVTSNERFVESEKTKQLLIQIVEGPRVRIDKIEITGRISRPAKYYANFIKDKSSDIIDEGYYVREDLENGYKNLTTELNNQGYLKAKILSSRADYNKNKDAVKVTVDIDEGPITQLTQIHFSGVNSFTEQQLLSQMSIRDQAPLRLYQLEESIAALKTFYHDRGFLEMTLLNSNENVVTYDDKGVKASIEFKIHEGPQIFVKSIVLEGNTFTKDHVIRRAVEIDVGDLLTPHLIDEGKKRLEKLGAFSKIDIHTLEANTNISQRTLIIAVSEANPGIFKVGAGASNKNNFTVRGYSGISYNNIKGTGRAVSIYGTIEQSLSYLNLLEYELDLGYLEPFLFDTTWRGRVNYTWSKLLLDIQQDQLQETNRLTFSTEKDITSHIKFTYLFWGHDSIIEYSVPPSGPLKYEPPDINVGYVGPTLDFDFRDNPFLPTKGTYFRLSYIYADPNLTSSPNIDFWKSEATLSAYFHLPGLPKVIWANSVRGGWEESLSDLTAVHPPTINTSGSGIPISYAYFLGGPTTVRGYTGTNGDTIPSNAQFPITTSNGQINLNQIIIPSQSDFILLKSEIRFPIHDIFGGVVFCDAGEVDIAGYPFTDPFKVSIGLGLRINTPLGPLALDYGHKLNPDPGLSNYAWALSIGTF